jgi:hypothetical protein
MARRVLRSANYCGGTASLRCALPGSRRLRASIPDGNGLEIVQAARLGEQQV